jgi:DNA polymerase III alpha subunit (gram-positive type)
MAGSSRSVDYWHVMTPISHNATCPSCRTGDLISICMTVSDRDLAFSTCHLCEAKWWYKDGELVPLDSVIGLVGSN